MKYPIPQEHITLGDIESDPEVQQTRRKLCASTKTRYGWMKFDTCVEVPRKKKKSDKDHPAIASSRDIARLLHETIPYVGRGREFLMIVCVDSKNVPVAIAVPHIGGRIFANVDASIIFQAAVLSGGVSFIVAHNHPSGVATPSEADVELTKRLVKGADLVGMTLLDHVIVTDDPSVYYSFLDKGIMPRA